MVWFLQHRRKIAVVDSHLLNKVVIADILVVTAACFLFERFVDVFDAPFVQNASLRAVPVLNIPVSMGCQEHQAVLFKSRLLKDVYLGCFGLFSLKPVPKFQIDAGSGYLLQLVRKFLLKWIYEIILRNSSIVSLGESSQRNKAFLPINCHWGRHLA